MGVTECDAERKIAGTLRFEGMTVATVLAAPTKASMGVVWGGAPDL